MKKFAALLFITSATLSISAVSHAEQIFTANGRAGLSGFYRWYDTTPEEKETLQKIAITQVKEEMKKTCLSLGTNQEPLVLDVTAAGSRYNHLADATVFKMKITYTCEAAAQ
ncbi:hypothetical protein [Bdellovibrio sp. HCB337]|uniref:hypothetical protein n=1 Tax=Bdellovibrio sp. HCB337 TaxID=3394358 RepID=UPI0039A47E0D